MVSSASNFASKFNQAIISRKKSFVIPVSSFSTALLKLLYRSGYLFSYRFLDNQTYLVFPNLRSVSFKLKIISGDSRTRQVSARRLRFFSNSGISFIANTFAGLTFSDIAVMSKLGGEIIFKLEPIK